MRQAGPPGFLRNILKRPHHLPQQGLHWVGVDLVRQITDGRCCDNFLVSLLLAKAVWVFPGLCIKRTNKSESSTV